MKKIFYIYSTTLLILLSGCREEAQKPKVIYDASNKSNVVAKSDSTQILRYPFEAEREEIWQKFAFLLRRRNRCFEEFRHPKAND